MVTNPISLAIVDDPSSRGPLDNVIGLQLRDCEKRIRGNDLESLKNRWYSGGLMLRLRDDNGRLPMGGRQALIEQLGISGNEINKRMKLAEKYQVDDLDNLLHKFLTWHFICRKALYEPRPAPKKPAKKGPAPIARTARSWTETLATRVAAQPLTDADRRALVKLAKLIERVLEGEPE